MCIVNVCRLTRFDEGEVPVYHVSRVPDIFTHVGRPSGEMQEIWLSEKDYNCAHSYVLRNCDYFQPFERYNLVYHILFQYIAL